MRPSLSVFAIAANSIARDLSLPGPVSSAIVSVTSLQVIHESDQLLGERLDLVSRGCEPALVDVSHSPARPGPSSSETLGISDVDPLFVTQHEWM